MLLRDFLSTQNAGSGEVAWLDVTGSNSPIPEDLGLSIHRTEKIDVDGPRLPVVVAHGQRTDDVIVEIARRPESSRAAMLTSHFLSEAAVVHLVSSMAPAGLRLLHAVGIDDAAVCDVFSAFALQRVQALPVVSDDSWVEALGTANLATLERCIPDRRPDSRREYDHARRQCAHLQQDLAKMLGDLRRVEAELAALRASVTMQVGRAVVDVARAPRTGIPELPRRLREAWRSHRTTPRREGTSVEVRQRPAQPRLTFELPLPVPPHDRSAGRLPRSLTIDVPRSLYVARVLESAGLRAYEPEVLSWFLALGGTARPGAVWDVGANLGIYGLLARIYSGREVVGFEPTPEVAAWARRIAADNDLSYRLEQLAVGETESTATLFLSDRTDSSNSLAKGFRKSSHDVEVLVESLDRYASLTGGQAAILKIDTETTEHLVLRGARRILAEHRPWVLCEVLANREPARRLTEVMRGTGYHYYQLTGESSLVEQDEITGDPRNTFPNYLLAPVEPDRETLEAARAWRTAVSACPTPTHPPSAMTHGGRP
jgi:FkbM family methyltransferase